MSSAGLSIGELVGTVSLNDQFSGPINNVAKALGLSSESFKAITGAAGIAGGAIVAAAGAIASLGVHGAAVDDVRNAFSGLSREAGSSAEVMLGKLQDATLGTISNFDLMAMANRAMGSGMVKSSDDMAALAGGAKLLADRTGGDTAQAFEKLVTTMAKGKTTGLKQLGIFVDSSTAAEQYAASLGKTVKDLTDEEKAAAMTTAGLAALKRELAANGPMVKDFADFVDIGKVAVQNFVDDLAVAVANSPVVRAGMESMGQAIQAAFGGTQQDTVKTLMGFVNQFAIFLVEAAQVGVEAARFIDNAFTGTKVIFNGFLGALASGIADVSGFLADLAAKGATLPGALGEQFKATAGGLQTMHDVADSLSIGFNELAEGAIASAESQNAAFDAVQATLEKTAGSMRAAMSAGVELGTGAEAAATGLRNAGEAAHLSAEQIKAIEDATRAGQNALIDMAREGADKFKALQDELTLANMTGTEARLFEIEQAREKEIAGLQPLAFAYPQMYEQLTTLVQEKYAQMSAAAQGHFQTVALAAAAEGFQTRAELEQTAATAQATYEAMKSSGLFTIEAVRAAHDKAEKAKQLASEKGKEFQMSANEAVVSGATQLFGVLGERFKAAAIAGAIIATYMAVAKALASAPWPFSLIVAAGALAAGLANVAKIRSSDSGWATGTPGTSFVDFGRGTATTLHGPEAVVTQAQGESVAGMVEDALRLRDSRIVEVLERMEDAQRHHDRLLPGRLRDAVLLGMA